ncbi:MAG: hypothetical protein JNM25_14010 [Planctomycetes bacterium]|nr:hypothetical protein [Planctomycetota bacterium]
MTVAARERNLLEAWLHGWAVILGVIAATIAFVLVLMLACGTGLTWQDAGMVGSALLAAGALEFCARLARTP